MYDMISIDCTQIQVQKMTAKDYLELRQMLLTTLFRNDSLCTEYEIKLWEFMKFGCIILATSKKAEQTRGAASMNL